MKSLKKIPKYIYPRVKRRTNRYVKTLLGLVKGTVEENGILKLKSE